MTRPSTRQVVRLTSLLCLLTLAYTQQAQLKTIPYAELPTSSGNPSGSGMHFGAVMSANQVTITFAGNVNRWIAIGFGTAMSSTDVFIYSCGHSLSSHAQGWFDYYNSSYNASGVLVDSQQDWTVVSTGTNTSSQRTVVATRTLSTGDANDVAFNYTAAALSLVWARGATADYTIAYHGSTNRAQNITRYWLTPATPSFVTNTTTVCAGSSITYSNLSTGGQTTYTWSFQGASTAASTATNPVVTYTQPGTYSVALTASNALGASSATFANYVTVTPTVAASATITAASGTVCQGSAASFTVNATNGGASPNYQWKVNGVNSGTNGPVFSSTTLSNGANITVVVQSNAACAVPASVTAGPVTMTVFSNAPATVSAGLSSGTNPMCQGAAATFTAAAGNGGASPSYQWKVNGANAGSNSGTFTSTGLLNGDLVSLEMTSGNTCASPTLATSNVITMTVSSVLVPGASVAVTGNQMPVCAGEVLVFSVTPTNGGSSPTFLWRVNGVSTGSTGLTFTTNALQNGDQVTCELVSSSSCASPQSTVSAAITASILPLPATPTISVAGGTLLCAGKTATLTSSSGPALSWSNGSSDVSLLVTGTGTFTVTQTTGGCTSLPSAVVQVSIVPNPTVALAPAGPFCVDDGPFLFSGEPSGGVYSGEGMTNSTFDPSTGAGTYIVQYEVTGPHNCTSSASVAVIVSACTGLEAVSTQTSSALFPNPADHVVTITAGSPTSILVTDLGGRVILEEQSDSHGIMLETSRLTNGLYLVELRSGEKRQVHLLSIQH